MFFPLQKKHMAINRRIFCYLAKSHLDRKTALNRVITALKLVPAIRKQNIEINEKTNFAKDLKLDSLDRVEVVLAVEEEFDFNMDEDITDKIHTVHDAVEAVLNAPKAM